MAAKFFHDEFIEALRDRIPRRPDLVREVAEILKIEKEPASRRLNGMVNFSIDEMAVLARTLNMSIDPMIHRGDDMLSIPQIFELPWKQGSMDSLADMIDEHVAAGYKICTENTEFGMVAGSLPIEFFMHHEPLMKFFLFKWGHFFIGSSEFNDYASWEIPPRFYKIKEKVRKHCVAHGKVLYIWDDALIWVLVRELKYLSVMHVIDAENKEVLRKELHTMLSAHETWLKGLDDSGSEDVDITFYISSIQLGVNGWHLASSRGHVAFFETHFTRTNLLTDRDSCNKVKEWINALKKVSYMVSGSGHKERRLFFEEQHKIVDLFLSYPKP